MKQLNVNEKYLVNKKTNNKADNKVDKKAYFQQSGLK